tara:strand:+ start:704 stop:904 length:201 start_codon:yes stop_codon:yes gene_type:complete
MTTGFGEYFLTFNIRNGVGLDLEFTDSRAVWASNSDTGELTAVSFEGVVVLIPFFIVTFGKIWSED